MAGPAAGAGLWEWSELDSTSVRGKRGVEHTGPNPVDRGKWGSKFHLLVDRQGVPLAVLPPAPNVHDSTLLERLVDAVPPIRRPIGQPKPPTFPPGQAPRRQRL
jgi:Transposase DDE domain